MIKTLPQFQSGDDELLYNIGVVARMTGISMATLRAWERRYNFPATGRTEGGHRLYSENDILQLRWVKQRIEEGMQTAQAINALRHMDRNDLASLPSISIKTEQTSNFYEQYQNSILSALFQHNTDLADQIFNDALSHISLELFIQNVIIPLFTTIGLKWQQHEIGIDTEHLATNYLRQKFYFFFFFVPPPLTQKPVVLACAPNELHEGGLLIIGSLLRRRRIPIAYLGQTVPLEDLKRFILETMPAAVIVVAMTEATAKELINWQEVMPEVAQSSTIHFYYAGLAYIEHPYLIEITTGIYLGDNIPKAVDLIEKLVLERH